MTDLGNQQRVRIPSRTEIPELAAAYRSASPWRHIRLDGIIPPKLTAAAYEQEMAHAPDAPKLVRRTVSKSETREGLGPAAREILRQLDSPEFVAFLRELTGIADLESDLTHAFAGLHANGPGNYHRLHHDFTLHPVDGRWHRANLLVYLNPVWPQEYGGSLELWAHRGRTIGARITPAPPTVVFFETTPDAIHGLPDLVTCPPGGYRLSLAAYYYSASRPPRPRFCPIFRGPRRPQDAWTTAINGPREIVLQVKSRLQVGASDLRALRRRFMSWHGPLR